MSVQKEEIEKILILAEGKSAAALEMIIDRALSQPQIFVFGEFLALPNIKEVSLFLFLTFLLAWGKLKTPGDSQLVCIRNYRGVQSEQSKVSRPQTSLAKKTWTTNSGRDRIEKAGGPLLRDHVTTWHQWFASDWGQNHWMHLQRPAQRQTRPKESVTSCPQYFGSWYQGHWSGCYDC